MTAPASRLGKQGGVAAERGAGVALGWVQRPRLYPPLSPPLPGGLAGASRSSWHHLRNAAEQLSMSDTSRSVRFVSFTWPTLMCLGKTGNCLP